MECSRGGAGRLEFKCAVARKRRNETCGASRLSKSGPAWRARPDALQSTQRVEYCTVLYPVVPSEALATIRFAVSYSSLVYMSSIYDHRNFWRDDHMVRLKFGTGDRPMCIVSKRTEGAKLDLCVSFMTDGRAVRLSGTREYRGDLQILGCRFNVFYCFDVLHTVNLENGGSKTALGGSHLRTYSVREQYKT